MKRKYEYIPYIAGEFDDFFRNLAQYTALKTTGAQAAWKHIPPETVSGLNTAYLDWYNIYILSLKPHGHTENDARRKAYHKSAALIRSFVKQYLRFPPVTDGDRNAMGINNYDTVRSTHFKVTELVEASANLKGIRSLLLGFKIKGVDHNAKPPGYTGAVIAWDVLDKPPTRPQDLTRKVTATRSPHLLNFDESERGKTAYYSLAWQNRRGILGDWSAIQSAIIP